MNKAKEVFLEIVGGLGWVAFGILGLRTEVVPFWAAWFALLVGSCMVAWGLDYASDPKRRW